MTTTGARAELGGRTPADPMPGDPDWSGGTVLEHRRTAGSAARPSAVYATRCGIGGTRGWYAAEPLWTLRGLVDLLVDGIGLRRGRRHPDELRVGDPLDFRQVEALEPEPAGCTRLDQPVRLHPRALLGRAYWYALVPFHAFVFGPLARRLAAEAEHPGRDGPSLVGASRDLATEDLLGGLIDGDLTSALARRILVLNNRRTSMEILVFTVGFLAFVVSTLGTVAGLLVERRARTVEPAIARVAPLPVDRGEPASLRVVRNSGVAS